MRVTQLTPRGFIIKTMARVYSSERSEPANLICENVDGDFPPISQACLFLEGRLAGWPTISTTISRK